MKRLLLSAALALLAGCAAVILSFESTGPVKGLAPLEQLSIAWNPMGDRRLSGHRGISPAMAPFERHDGAFERAFASRLTALLATRGVRVVAPQPGVPSLWVGVVHRTGGCRGPCGTFVTFGGVLFESPDRPLWTFTLDQRADKLDTAAFDKMLTAILDEMADDGLLRR